MFLCRNGVYALFSELFCFFLLSFNSSCIWKSAVHSTMWMWHKTNRLMIKSRTCEMQHLSGGSTKQQPKNKITNYGKRASTRDFLCKVPPVIFIQWFIDCGTRVLVKKEKNSPFLSAHCVCVPVFVGEPGQRGEDFPELLLSLETVWRFAWVLQHPSGLHCGQKRRIPTETW